MSQQIYTNLKKHLGYIKTSELWALNSADQEKQIMTRGATNSALSLSF